MKRFVSLILSVFLIFSCAPAVMAEDGGDTGGIVGGLLDGLKALFIPSEQFFEDFNRDIQTAIDKKTGGLTSAFKSITQQFNGLTQNREVNKLSMTVPDNLFYSGYKGIKVDLFQGIDSFATWFRGLFSGFIVIITIIICYRKTASLFKQ